MSKNIHLDALTERERAVVDLLAQGYGTKQIAARLGRAAPTISTQKKSALRKLKVSSAVELALHINGVTVLKWTD
ncbi:helix-turn-helix transcriptional regulator [Stenotrophomonas sp. CFBP8980]|uniref:helix-turn-helix domain-containing protein n=1 Tax=Stenotrophomonas sp. CFBP8980 TaxID=3096523 RepID=UPI002A6B1410|nr:helix-turn-helix transcriptional regulator [Stenotrophomonas sp. CFBP8980]MDY1035191.1 helix-turn-helix transcriptional regulator [Stenotrophomonas sp. CFBP8980]